MKISSISKFGLVRIKFSESVVAVGSSNSKGGRFLTDITSIDRSVFEVSVMSFYEEMQPLKSFTWETFSLGKTELLLQLNFDYPSYVSDEVNNRDELQVKLIDPLFFISESRFVPFSNKDVLLHKIPHQLEPSAEEKLERIKE